MAPWVQVLLVACAVALTVALVSVLLALKKTAQRADSVLGMVERDLRPMTSELTALLTEVRGLSGRANKEMERVSVIVERVDEVAAQASRVAQAIGGVTRIGQVVALLVGLKRGTDVFVKRLKQ